MIERMEFGRTGHESSRVIFGAAALGGTVGQTCKEFAATMVEARIREKHAS